HAFAKASGENERRAKALLFGLENSFKGNTGRFEALQDAKAMAAKAAQEKALQAKVASDPDLVQRVGDPWATIAAIEKKADARIMEARFVGFGGSRLLGIAGTIVQYPAEIQKPNDIRLQEFRESGLASLENRLYSPAPAYDDLEIVTLTDQLEQAQDALGKDHPFIKAVLQGKTPSALAQEVVSGSKLKDPAARKALVKGGAAAVQASKDPLIVLARRIDPLAREVRKWREEEIQASLDRVGEKLAEARWKIQGKTVPPDATFTLRLSYGTVKPYPAEGTSVAPLTTFYGLYDRSLSWGSKAPWALAKRWVERKPALDLGTALNFVSTADIIGGNSGSPTINRMGEFVGIIFDGNIESLALDYFYTDEKARAVSVDSRGILEALRKIYDAGAIADELSRSGPNARGTSTKSK
ncbi:MAG TPA: S46 family peptidase, partial [Vicinamibacteria bacterium]|nr:S46 family peptidase [Vicinamibacteria bacterium]